MTEDEQRRMMFLESALVEFATRENRLIETLERHGIPVDLEKRQLKYTEGGGIRWAPTFDGERS